MTTIMELPTVAGCSVGGCSYNHGMACAAPAITVGKSACVTFIPLSVKGGLDKVISHVGACQRNDCVHNDHLECTAASIRVGSSEGETADCMTFAKR